MLPSFFPSLAPLATAASAWCTDTGALASVRARSANPVWSAWAYVSCPCYLRVDLRPSPGLCCLHVGANTRTARDIRPQPARAKISAARLADPASGLRPAAIDTPVPAGRRYRTTTQRTGRPAGAGSHARLGRTTARTRRDSSSRQHTGPEVPPGGNARCAYCPSPTTTHSKEKRLLSISKPRLPNICGFPRIGLNALAGTDQPFRSGPSPAGRIGLLVAVLPGSPGDAFGGGFGRLAVLGY